MFIRANKLSDKDLRDIIEVMKNNITIKVLDLSSNQTLSPSSVIQIGQILDSNRTCEYVGLAKLGLKNEHVTPLIGLMGKFPFPEDKV